jgi:hypothetical protein
MAHCITPPRNAPVLVVNGAIRPSQLFGVIDAASAANGQKGPWRLGRPRGNPIDGPHD